MYAKIVNNEVVVYPYNLIRLYKENPNVSFPAEIPEAILNDYNIYSIAEASVPSHDYNTQRTNMKLTQLWWTAFGRKLGLHPFYQHQLQKSVSGVTEMSGLKKPIIMRCRILPQ